MKNEIGCGEWSQDDLIDFRGVLMVKFFVIHKSHGYRYPSVGDAKHFFAFFFYDYDMYGRWTFVVKVANWFLWQTESVILDS